MKGKNKNQNQNQKAWHTGLMGSVVIVVLLADCCFALWCPCCATCMLRKRAIYDDLSRYRCCGTETECYMPCFGCCKKYCGQECCCPGCCLCIEGCLCFPFSLATTRYVLQDEFNLKNTSCYDCIEGCMACRPLVSALLCLLCLSGHEDLVLSCTVNIIYVMVSACMQTQHKVEMDKRDGKFGPTKTTVPPTQQMSRIAHPVPTPANE